MIRWSFSFRVIAGATRLLCDSLVWPSVRRGRARSTRTPTRSSLSSLPRAANAAVQTSQLPSQRRSSSQSEEADDTDVTGTAALQPRFRSPWIQNRGSTDRICGGTATCSCNPSRHLQSPLHAVPRRGSSRTETLFDRTDTGDDYGAGSPGNGTDHYLPKRLDRHTVRVGGGLSHSMTTITQPEL